MEERTMKMAKAIPSTVAAGTVADVLDDIKKYIDQLLLMLCPIVDLFGPFKFEYQVSPDCTYEIVIQKKQ